MPDLHLFGGEKGGVGKSFICRAALQFHLDNKIPCTVFDTDRSNPDVMRIYQSVGCKVAIFSEGERYEDKANAVYNAAIKKRVLVNLPAQVFIPITNWIEKNELLDIAPEDNVKFYHWFVSDNGYDSLKLFRHSVEYFKSDIPHIFVRNWGRCDDWEQNEELEALINDYQVKVIDFPKFIGTSDRNRIDSESLTFAKARDSKKFSSIGRQRVKRFLREAYQAFATTELF
jgi:hypothetical protein